MALKTPYGFENISSASTQLNREVNVIGIVTDFLPPSKSRGGDWMNTFTIWDNSCHDDGFKVRFFKPIETDLPKVQGTGDVIILRCLKVKEWSGMIVGLSSHGTNWLVFPAAVLTERTPINPPKVKHFKDTRALSFSPPEMHYAVSLHNSRERSASTLPATEVSRFAPIQDHSQVRREKFSLVKDIQINIYYDLIGQVLKMYPTGSCVEVYITDYTSNQLLYNYEWGRGGAEEAEGRDGDEYNYIARNSKNRTWEGPFGKNTLMVCLWQPHSDFAKINVKEQDFVFLKNVRIRQSRDGSKIEGAMHTDKNANDRINVVLLKDRSDDRVKDVLRRKLEYTKWFNFQKEKYLDAVAGQKRNQPESLRKIHGKKRRKQQREQQREQEQKLEMEAESEQVIEQAIEQQREQQRERENEQQEERRKEGRKNQLAERKHQTSPPKQIDKARSAALPAVLSDRQQFNKNVVSAHSDVPTRPLSSILSLSTHVTKTPAGTTLTLPFQNINSRALVRIIDFFPSKIADFAVRCPRPSEFDVLSDNDDSDSTTDDESDDGQEENRWEWRFGLVLEDAMARRNEEKAIMKVYVAEQDAEFLLKLDAENLRASPSALSALRSKLTALWGDLEERKANPPLPHQISSKPSSTTSREHSPKSAPFECCLKEYGIKTRRRKGDCSGADEEEEQKEEGEGEGKQKKWGWERKWRMWGTTIQGDHHRSLRDSAK